MPTTSREEELPEAVARLFLLAQGLAEQTPSFFDVKGPGAGDRAALEFMETLRKIAGEMFGPSCKHEHKVCAGAGFALDFYFTDEATAVEIALSLDKPVSEYERDIFKCLLAKDEGHAVTRLLFITKPGSLKRNNAPGPRAIASWVKEKFDLEIQILEMHPPETTTHAGPRLTNVSTAH